jgi:hypothetical protein
MFVGRRVRRKAQERSAVEKHTANTLKYGPGVRRTDARVETASNSRACANWISTEPRGFILRDA